MSFTQQPSKDKLIEKKKNETAAIQEHIDSNTLGRQLSTWNDSQLLFTQTFTQFVQFNF